MKVKKSAGKKTGKKVKINNEELEIVLVDPFIVQEAEDFPLRPIDKKHVRELAKDIATNGLDIPITLWNGGDADNEMEVEGDVYPAAFLVAGHHRLTAIKSLKTSAPDVFKARFADGVPSIIRSCSHADAMCISLRENVQRKNPKASEILPVMVDLRDNHKMKAKDIAKSVGKSAAWVSQIFGIEDAGEDFVAAVQNDDVSLQDAKEAAATVRKAKKSGKKVDAKAELGKAKAKAAKRKASGKVRSDRKPSLKKLWARCCALPSMSLSKKNGILENMIQYLLDEPDSHLPTELQDEDAPVSAPKAKKSKKSKK